MVSISLRGVYVWVALFLLVFVHLVEAFDDETAWIEYKSRYNKTYKSESEEKFRKKIFLDNKSFIDSHNTKQTVRFTQGVNHLSDLTPSEVASSLNGFKLTEEPVRSDPSIIESIIMSMESKLNHTASLLGAAPIKLDYRKLNRVSRVKNQGSCGSCWSFATTGTLESILALRRRPILLSEQNLIDCSGSYGNKGCSGGLMDKALKYVRDFGIMSAREYPYSAKEDRCKFSRVRSIMRVRGAAILPSGNETLLKLVLARTGPLPVAIDASLRSFHQYKSGVYDDDECKSSAQSLDHAVLLVGYGTDPTEGDYWIVKNSWGKEWGDNGFIKLARNRKNQCGIATYAVLPVPYR